MLISSCKAGEQAPHLDLAEKGCIAEVCFWPVIQKRVGPAEKIRRTVTVFPWSALLVDLQLERAPAAFFCNCSGSHQGTKTRPPRLSESDGGQAQRIGLPPIVPVCGTQASFRILLRSRDGAELGSRPNR